MKSEQAGKESERSRGAAHGGGVGGRGGGGGGGGGRPLVIQTEHLDAQAAAWLGGRCRLEQVSSDDPRFGALLGEAQGLVIRTYTKVDEAMLAKAPRLKVVGRAGLGLDNVDVEACRARGVTVVSTPGANTRAVVEYVTAMLLDLLRPRVFVERALGIEEWKRLRNELIASRQLAGLTLGVVGLGRVGSGIARVGAAMDMRVVFHDLVEFPPELRFGAEAVSMERLLSESDVISLHVDGRKSNKGLLNAAALSRCKPDVVIVNTSRGFVVDAAALAEFLKAHPAASALIDVHEPEPFGSGYPLLGLPNAHLSAHIAAATKQAHANMSWVVRDVARVLKGEAPEFPA